MRWEGNDEVLDAFDGFSSEGSDSRSSPQDESGKVGSGAPGIVGVIPTGSAPGKVCLLYASYV